MGSTRGPSRGRNVSWRACVTLIDSRPCHWKPTAGLQWPGALLRKWQGIVLTKYRGNSLRLQSYRGREGRRGHPFRTAAHHHLVLTSLVLEATLLPSLTTRYIVVWSVNCRDGLPAMCRDSHRPFSRTTAEQQFFLPYCYRVPVHSTHIEA